MLTPLLTLLLLAPLASDKIFRIGQSKPIAGTVVSEDCTKVQYRRPGVSQTLDLDATKVARIEYEDAPEAYTKGLDLLQAGDFENAASNFKLSLQSRTRNNWIKIHGAYRLGLALALQGSSTAAKYREAADVFEGLMKDHPENRFLTEALKRWGECLAAAGDAAGAAAVYDRLAQDAKDKKLGLRWEASSKLWKADAYAANGDSQAEEAYRQAGAFAKSNASAQSDAEIVALLESINSRAELSQGDALLRNKKYREARQFFEKIAQNSSASEEALAGAMCGIGEVLLAEDKPEDALEQFARVRVLHHLVRDHTARATFLMGRCMLVLGDKEPGSKRKAREYFTEVADRFQDTQWAQKAQAEIQ